MKTICFPRIEINHDHEYPYNVQLWYSDDGGIIHYYSGEGKFFKEYDDAAAYFSEHSTLPEFPVITKERQFMYLLFMESNGTPMICGIYGAACRQMDKAEGANRALCEGCKLAHFCHVMDVIEYLKEE